MEKETYYVQIHPTVMKVSEVKVDDNTIQYGIRATPEEKVELEEKIKAVQHDDASPSLLLERVHDEYLEDEAKDTMKSETRQLFQKIYNLGTPETKRFFEERGIPTF